MNLLFAIVSVLTACGSYHEHSDSGKAEYNTDPAIEDALADALDSLAILQTQLAEQQQRLDAIEQQYTLLLENQSNVLVKETQSFQCVMEEDGIVRPEDGYWDFMDEAKQNNWLVSEASTPFRTCYNWELLEYEEGELVIAYAR